MIFGILAIFCWLFLLSLPIAFAIVAVRKHRVGLALLCAFLIGGLSAGLLIWQSTRPEGLAFRDSLRAGLTDEGLREYGHPMEHRAEVAICLSTYACVLGGALCAGTTLAIMRIRARRKTA